MSLVTIGALLVAFQIKHFLADFPFQSQYMLGKFKETGWVGPLAAHCSVHAGLTALICLVCLWGVPGGLPILLGLTIFDFTVHFTMDRIKASPRMLGRFKALTANEYKSIAPYPNLGSTIHGGKWIRNSDLIRGNTYFWWALGLDQAVHHLTHYAIIIVILRLM